MPSSTQTLPVCTGRASGRHQWRMSLGRTARLRTGRAETCRHCGMRRIVTGSGQVIRDA